MRDLGSGRFDGEALFKSMTEADNNPVEGVNGQTAQLTSRYQDTVPEALVQNYEDAGLTAGMDDCAFQGVDTAFFDSIMRGLDNVHSSGIWNDSPSSKRYNNALLIPNVLGPN